MNAHVVQICRCDIGCAKIARHAGEAYRRTSTLIGTMMSPNTAIAMRGLKNMTRPVTTEG